MTPAELLESLRLYDEQTRIEAKRASSSGPSILETVCAFANEPDLRGGWILLGVARNESAPSLAWDVVGVSDPDKLKSDIVSQCRDMFNRPVRIEFEDAVIEGAHVVGLFVPEAEPSDKPIFFKSRGLPAGAFRRMGASDVRCTEDDLLALYQERATATGDARTVPGTTMDDIDPAAIAEYRSALLKANPDAESARWLDAELLEAVSCLAAEGGEPRATLAGLLLFGTSRALRKHVPLFRVDYIRIPGTEWMEGDDSIVSLDMRDSLLNLVRRTVSAVVDDLPKAFSLPKDSLQREETASIPHRALREAVVNALMHRNYRNNAPVQVIRYSDRLEIRNPGYSLKPEDSLGDSGSMHRNPVIAAILHETRFAETKGAGIRVIRNLMADTGLTPPVFESDREKDEFCVTFFFHHFLEAEDLAWLGAFKDIELSQEEARALVFLRDYGWLSNAVYRDLNRSDTLQASLRLRRLREAGLLEQKGRRGPGTHYVGARRFLATITPGIERSVKSPATLGQESGPLGQESGPLGQESGPLGQESVIYERQPSELLPRELAERIASLGKRASSDRIKQIIGELCAIRPMGADELGRLLDRDPSVLVRKYLSPMLRSGALRYLYPGSPNAPNQKYATPGRT